MPASVVCPRCQRDVKVPDALLGKKIRCPACKGILNTPAGATEAAPAAPAPERPAPVEALAEPVSAARTILRRGCVR